MPDEEVRKRDARARDGRDLARIYLSSLARIDSKQRITYIGRPFEYKIERIKNILSESDIFTFSCGEYMLPHTHGNSIFLPHDYDMKSPHALAMIMIHECIHIFQGMYPIETHAYLMNVWNMRICGFSEVKRGRKASNPDVNNLAYISETDDHPYEFMAYRITDILFKKAIPARLEHEWMVRYL